MTKKLIYTSLVTALLASTAPAMAKHHEKDGMANASASLSAVVSHERRAKDKVRDRYRHPLQTISFFGVEPHHTVVEYSPGVGWYSKILAPYVAAKGKFIGLQFAPDPLPFPDAAKERIRGFGKSFTEGLNKSTGIPVEKLSAYTADQVPDELNGTADIVIVPRMMHNLMRWNVADYEVKVWRSMLKENGHVGIIQHRAKDDTPFSYSDGNKGYLRTDQVINFMEAHGFELVKQSEVNANPKDTADYENGVWTLPPRLATSKDNPEDKATYEAIGESDRMTLLFKKLP